MRLKDSNRSATPHGPESASRVPRAPGIGREQAAQERADDDGMAVANDRVRSSAADVAGVMLDELGELSTHGGERDAPGLARFQSTVAALRAQPGATGPFRAKVASAAGWAALLFSSWRHLKYNRPNSSGADRVRAFITGDLLDARRLLRLDQGNNAHDRARGIGAGD